MKKITQLVLVFTAICLCTKTAIAQDYSFTLMHDNNYDFTLAAVADFDSGAFAPITQSYGFTLVIPDNITITFNNYLPTGSSAIETPISGTSVQALDPSMSNKDLYLITADTAGLTFAPHTNGAIIPLVQFTIDGSPNSGDITILDNNSTLATAPSLNGALNSFIQVDVIDNGMVAFNNEFSGLSGISSYNLATLSSPKEINLEKNISIYPNPVKTDLYITFPDAITQTKAILYNISGKMVSTHHLNEIESSIDVSKLQNGVYFISFEAENYAINKRFIKH